ncbi:hypothetical protein [Devosia naphthalenivorans]|uniref:hypothetical protein n=1 Tax=Devosia naphthalenivorans TaxID=2082392 RepID=UPI0013B054EE|nr:hypothetical protein [Devosia naphthalenivorans]
MSKVMSRTMAGEIAERTMAVVNPANRAMALRAALQRHGFAGGEPEAAVLAERKALIGWLLASYSPRA